MQSSIKTPNAIGRIAPWVVALVGLLAFANSLANDYAYDDVPVVVEGSRLQDGARWSELWTTDYWYDLRKSSPNRDLLYRPLTLTTIRVVRAMLGNSAWPQRVLNIALHAAVSVLVLILARNLGAGRIPAILSGLVFASLPVHAEVVNAVTGRADLLVSFMLILSLYFHARVMGAPTSGPKVKWMIAAGATAFAAMTSKENGVAVVPILILCDAYLHRTKPNDPVSPWFSVTTAARLGYLVVPLGLYLALRYHALGGHFSQPLAPTRAMNALVDTSLLQRVLGPIQLWGMYWAKTIWPASRNIKYTIRGTTAAASPIQPHVLMGLAVLALAIVLAWRHWVRGSRTAAFVFACLLICYLPVSNSFVLIQEFFAERFWYVPSIFAMVFLALVFTELLKTIPDPVPLAGITVVCIALVARCWVRTAEWKNNETLYAAAYRDAPDSVGALLLFGDWLTLHDRVEEGIGLLQKALSIDPTNVDAHRSLAHAYTTAGNPVAAQKHFEAVAQFNPQATPYNNLGVSYARQGRFAEAEQMFQHALGDPDAAAFARYNLGLICQRTQRIDQAIGHWEESLRLNPRSEPTVDGLVSLYFAVHRTKDAFRIYQHATEFMPHNPRYWLGLARILATSKDDSIRDGQRALAAAEKANALIGVADANILSVMAAAYAEMGSFGDAVRVASHALQVVQPTEKALKEALDLQLKHYQAGQPYRDDRM